MKDSFLRRFGVRAESIPVITDTAGAKFVGESGGVNFWERDGQIYAESSASMSAFRDSARRMTGMSMRLAEALKNLHAAAGKKGLFDSGVPEATAFTAARAERMLIQLNDMVQDLRDDVDAGDILSAGESAENPSIGALKARAQTRMNVKEDLSLIAKSMRTLNATLEKIKEFNDMPDEKYTGHVEKAAERLEKSLLAAASQSWDLMDAFRDAMAGGRKNPIPSDPDDDY